MRMGMARNTVSNTANNTDRMTAHKPPAAAGWGRQGNRQPDAPGNTRSPEP